MIVLIGGTKGGTGKTTIATNVATEAVNNGLDVLLVDSDKQASSTSWVAVRDANINDGMEIKKVPSIQKYGVNLNRELELLQKKYINIIVDVGGYDAEELRSALVVANMFYIPVLSSQTDIWALSHLIKIIAQATVYNKSLISKIIINRAHTNPKIATTRNTLNVLQELKNEYIDVSNDVVHDRIAFVYAVSNGCGVSEIEQKDLKACKEITKLYKDVFENSLEK